MQVKTKRRHTVTFLSPGSLVAESTTKEIGKWDTRAAVQMARGVTERYGSKPYGFYFETHVVTDPIDDGEGGKLEVKPRRERRSGTVYINGRILSASDLDVYRTRFPALKQNAESNGWTICETFNSRLHHGVFSDEDAICDADGTITHAGPRSVFNERTNHAGGGDNG